MIVILLGTNKLKSNEMSNIISKLTKHGILKSDALPKPEFQEVPADKLEALSTMHGTFMTTVPDSYSGRLLWTRPDPRRICAFLPGTITEVTIHRGDVIKKGDKLLKFNAMKMDNTYASPIDGVVKKVHVKSGFIVPNGALLVEFE